MDVTSRSRLRILAVAGSVTLVVLAAIAFVAWPSESEAPPPPNAQPFAGWVPEPPGTLRAYADCLKASKVEVDRLVGMYVLVDRADPASADSCAAQRKAHQDTITVKNFEIQDQDGYRFVTQVRQCLTGNLENIPAEDEPIFRTNGDARRVEAFDACVEEIRARPTPTA